MNALHRVDATSEVAYDLLHDHLDTILSLIERPMARAEVVAQLGSDVTLRRLTRMGLVLCDDDTCRASGRVYHQMRQEGMIDFLEHYVLPPLQAGLHDEASDGFALLHNRPLQLSAAQIAGLRAGPVQDLFDALAQASDLPAGGVLSRMTVLVVGTSRVDADIGDAGDAALHHLQQASLQRSSEQERAQAVLSQFHFLADAGRYRSASAAIEGFIASFAPKTAAPSGALPRNAATYHLTVASHWRQSNAAVQCTVSRQTC